MPWKKIRYDSIYKAREMYAVLIDKERESRSYSKREMLEDLSNEVLYCEFLKTCLEFDDTEDLRRFRKGLYLVLNRLGMSAAARGTGIPRTTLYRILWKGGNPNLKYLVRVLGFLKLRLWVVSEEFIKTSQTKRFKHAAPDEAMPGRSRKIKNVKAPY